MAKNDLFTHTVYLLSAIEELPIREQLHDRLAAHAQELEDLPIIVEDALGDVYRRFALHSDAILQLTADDKTRDLMGKLGTWVRQQIEFLRSGPQKSIDLGKSQSTLGKFRRVAEMLAERLFRGPQITALMGQVHSHLTGTLDPDSDSVAG